MGKAGIKQGPRPSTTLPFLVNLNEKTLLKVSFKNIDWFQSFPNSKNTAFSKYGPVNPLILKKNPLNYYQPGYDYFCSAPSFVLQDQRKTNHNLGFIKDSNFCLKCQGKVYGLFAIGQKSYS